MFQLHNKHILIIGVVGAAILGGVLFYSSGRVFQQKEKPKDTQEAPEPEVLSVAGKVIAIDSASNSFVLLQPKEERQSTVRIGESTVFIRLVFPFDIANPPVNTTFTPERKKVAIGDLKVNDQVFVRASVPMRTGQDIVYPLEVQVLP